MRKIGIVGGLGPESTREYEEIICRRYNEISGGLNYPRMIIEYMNLQEIVDLQNAGDIEGVADAIVKSIYNLTLAGAEVAGIASNTPHIAFSRIKEKTQEYSMELVSIMDAVAEEIKEDGIDRVGLLGTKITMEFGHYQEALKPYGIEVIMPCSRDRKRVDGIIFDELVHGEISEFSREGYKSVIGDLEKGGAEGIVLACTEIGLLIKPEDVDTRIFDTAVIHPRKILDAAMR